MLKAKLVIWDLDDTIWSGTLAENDELKLESHRVEYIKLLNDRGVVNSICSKNDFQKAKTALEDFGIWDEFVFPEIQLEAKGQIVAQIISDMQLRAPDVIFIDDNDANLREVSFFNDGIQVLDATDPDTDSKLEEWVKSLAPGRSRVGEYRQLEAKREAKRESNLDNVAFLETCNIKVVVIRRSDNLPYAGRIEELVNRTNQMNFSKTRVAEGSMAEYLINPKNETFSVFAWDNFGFYGLVGFAAIEDSKVVHLAYSCRIMNMGVEQSVATVIADLFPGIEIPHDVYPAPWIEVLRPTDVTFQQHIKTFDSVAEPIPLRIMANCQSGAIAHYLGANGVSWDNWPRIFRLREMLEDSSTLVQMGTYVYGVFNDYSDQYWNEPPTLEIYTQAVEAFLGAVRKFDAEVIAILPTDNFDTSMRWGVSPERFLAFNTVWRRLASENTDLIKLIEVEELLEEKAHDPRHFTPDVLREIASITRGLVTKVAL